MATGTPDVDFCIDSVPGKIELKYSPSHPVRSSTPVLGRGNGLRRSQIIWVSRRNYAGGQVYVAIGTPRSTWFVATRGRTPAQLAGLELLAAPELAKISAWCADSHDWATLPRVLIERGPPARL